MPSIPSVSLYVHNNAIALVRAEKQQQQQVYNDVAQQRQKLHQNLAMQNNTFMKLFADQQLRMSAMKPIATQTPIETGS